MGHPTRGFVESDEFSFESGHSLGFQEQVTKILVAATPA